MKNPEDIKKLEAKVLKAKELGITFRLLSPNEGVTIPRYDVVAISQQNTDEEFEKQLDAVIKSVEEKNYLKILKDNKLI